MGKAESITSSVTRDRLAQLVEESIARANELAKQLASTKESSITGLRSQIYGTYTSLPFRYARGTNT